MAKHKARPGSLYHLAWQQDYVCALCGKNMPPSSRWNEVHWRIRPSVDHVVPKCLGGVDKLGNMLAAHGLCNNMKADRMPNGCEMIWLQAVNARMGIDVMKW